MKEFGLQLFSVRDLFTNEEDTKRAFRELGKMGYSHVQTAGTYDYITPEKFIKYATDAGIKICGTHYGYDRIYNDIEGTIKYHKILGTKYVGLGGMPAAIRNSKEGVLEFIGQMNERAKTLAQHGMKLTYHNHSFEFVKFDDGRTIFDYLIEGLDPVNISFCLDTFWMQYAGIDVRDMIERLAGRCDILHLKDMTAVRNDISKLDMNDPKNSHAQYPLAVIGEGVMNFKRIIETAEKAGVSYFVVEDDRCESGKSLLGVKRSADYIKANLLSE